MKKVSWLSKIFLIALLFCAISGCAASTPVIRKAQFLSETYNEQVRKDVLVISLIDARPDTRDDA